MEWKALDEVGFMQPPKEAFLTFTSSFPCSPMVAGIVVCGVVALATVGGVFWSQLILAFHKRRVWRYYSVIHPRMHALGHAAAPPPPPSQPDGDPGASDGKTSADSIPISPRGTIVRCDYRESQMLDLRRTGAIRVVSWNIEFG
jgi:hypothetical protein